MNRLRVTAVDASSVGHVSITPGTYPRSPHFGFHGWKQRSALSAGGARHASAIKDLLKEDARVPSVGQRLQDKRIHLTHLQGAPR